MGCEQSTKLRRHSYIEYVEDRPVNKIFNTTFKDRFLPTFVKAFLREYTLHKLTYVKAQYKDLFFHDGKVYALEEINNIEYNRRKIMRRKLLNMDVNFVMYNEIFYMHGCFIGVMEKYDMDLFEYLKTTKIDLDDFVCQICKVISSFHKNGIYLQDLKPENIFIKIEENDAPTYYIADFEYALMDHDFENPIFIKKRRWVRTLQYCPNVGKPTTIIEAVRTDLYALAVIIGRIETTYTNNVELNIFLNKRYRVVKEEWDDRKKLEHFKNNKYSTLCADFIAENFFYIEHINSFVTILTQLAKRTDNYTD